MFRATLLCSVLMLFLPCGEAQEILLPVPQNPPEHNVARFSDLIEIDVAQVPTVVPEHGERRASNVRETSRPARQALSSNLGISRTTRSTRVLAPNTPTFTVP